MSMFSDIAHGKFQFLQVYGYHIAMETRINCNKWSKTDATMVCKNHRMRPTLSDQLYVSTIEA